MEETRRSFRERVRQLTGRSSFIVAAVIASALLSLLGGQLGTALLYVVVLVTLWTQRWDWSYFSLTRPDWSGTVMRAILFAVGVFVVNDFIVQPWLEITFGPVDLSEVSQIEGSLPYFALFILLGWVLGGFCEEIIFRGYVLKRLAAILGNTTGAWLAATVIASVVFGLAHNYQGASGMMAAGFVALLFGIIFLFNKNNLFVLVLTHGIYNMIAITLLYLGKARIITDWVLKLIA